MTKCFYTLPEFIAERGDVLVANDLGVTRTTVYNWRMCKTVPYPRHAQKLIQLSRGSLTMDSIYGDVSPQSHTVGTAWKLPRARRVEHYGGAKARE